MPKRIYHCENCGIEFTHKKGCTNRFCQYHCYVEFQRKNKPKKYCQECNVELTTEHQTKFCSQSCAAKFNNIHSNKKPKSGTYKGIKCDSLFELAWVIYNLDHNLHFIRFDGHLTNGDLTYIPDFYIPDNNMIIEIKGHYQNRVEEKCQLARDNGYAITVLYEKNLKPMFDYVKNTYGNDLYSLYDEKVIKLPKYEKTCPICQSIFRTNNKTKKTCSKKCGGKLIVKRIHSTRNKSGYNGISHHKQMNKWQAFIQINGKNKYLGLYDTIEEAVSVRQKAVNEKYH